MKKIAIAAILFAFVTMVPALSQAHDNDKTVMGNSFPVPFTFYTAASLRPPRTYGLRAGFKF